MSLLQILSLSAKTPASAIITGKSGASLLPEVYGILSTS